MNNYIYTNVSEKELLYELTECFQDLYREYDIIIHLDLFLTLDDSASSSIEIKRYTLDRFVEKNSIERNKQISKKILILAKIFHRLRNYNLSSHYAKVSNVFKRTDESLAVLCMNLLKIGDLKLFYSVYRKTEFSNNFDLEKLFANLKYKVSDYFSMKQSKEKLSGFVEHSNFTPIESMQFLKKSSDIFSNCDKINRIYDSNGTIIIKIVDFGKIKERIRQITRGYTVLNSAIVFVGSFTKKFVKFLQDEKKGDINEIDKENENHNYIPVNRKIFEIKEKNEHFEHFKYILLLKNLFPSKIFLMKSASDNQFCKNIHNFNLIYSEPIIFSLLDSLPICSILNEKFFLTSKLPRNKLIEIEPLLEGFNTKYEMFNDPIYNDKSEYVIAEEYCRDNNIDFIMVDIDENKSFVLNKKGGKIVVDFKSCMLEFRNKEKSIFNKIEF